MSNKETTQLSVLQAENAELKRQLQEQRQGVETIIKSEMRKTKEIIEIREKLAAVPQEHKDALRKRDRRIEQLECFVKAYGPKSLQYDIEHPNDGLNAPVTVQPT